MYFKSFLYGVLICHIYKVHAPDADIDILCIAPKHVTRADWFDMKWSWCLLSLLTNDPDVTEMLSVPEAYTPVIKFKVHITHITISPNIPLHIEASYH